MSESGSVSKRFATLICVVLLTQLAACATSVVEHPADEGSAEALVANVPEKAQSQETTKLRDQERRQSERLKNCLEERRRLDAALQDSQKRVDELQRKISALLAVDREMRAREKGR